MPWQRRIYRGIDHARVIGTGVAWQLDCPLARALACSHRAPQLTLSASRRRRIDGRRLRIRSRWAGRSVRDRQVIVVDDVRTTGGSLRIAMRRIQSLGPHRIIAAVLAVADDPGRRQRGERLPPPIAMTRP